MSASSGSLREWRHPLPQVLACPSTSTDGVTVRAARGRWRRSRFFGRRVAQPFLTVTVDWLAILRKRRTVKRPARACPWPGTSGTEGGTPVSCLRSSHSEPSNACEDLIGGFDPYKNPPEGTGRDRRAPFQRRAFWASSQHGSQHRLPVWVIEAATWPEPLPLAAPEGQSARGRARAARCPRDRHRADRAGSH